MTDKPTLRAPWTAAQIDALNQFQTSGGMHPFTCGRDHEQHQTLIATYLGWICPDIGCDYRQDWAHPFMAQPDAWPKSPWARDGRHGPTPEEIKGAAFTAADVRRAFENAGDRLRAVAEALPSLGAGAAAWALHKTASPTAAETQASRDQALGGYCPDCGRGDAGPTADEYEASRRRAITLVERIDAARTWARQHLTAEQTEQLYAALRGDQPEETRP